MGLSEGRVRGMGVISRLQRVISSCRISRSLVSFRLARDTAVSGARAVRSVLRGLGTLKFGVSVSSFKANCSSFDLLGSVPFSALGVSGDFVSGVTSSSARRTRIYGSGVVVGRVVSVSGRLNCGYVTRNTRAGDRIRELGRVNYGIVRKFCFDGPVPLRRFRGGCLMEG